MKTEEKKENAEKKEETPKEDIPEASEENSENGDQEDAPGTNVNIASFITTPFERVLAIINDAKAFILSVTKEQQELIKGLEWTIKVISSHSLYSYEFKDQEYLNEMSQENPDFKQLVDFVNSYNDEVIQMNKRTRKSIEQSSLNLKWAKPIKHEEEKVDKIDDNNKKEEEDKNNDNNKEKKRDNNILRNRNNSSNKFNKKKRYTPNKKYLSKNISKSNVANKKPNRDILSPKPKRLRNVKKIEDNKILKSFSGIINTKQKKSENNKKVSDNHTEIAPIPKDSVLYNVHYPLNRILEKTFNIFELKEVVGQDKVLPIMGRVILDAFGFNVDGIISLKKLEPFLISVSNQYFPTTLYHNSLHGADVTQSIALYFLNSNAEEICQSLVLDILGILISALGHDLGHPGYTNPYHINSSSELAITYNDISCLENYHASKLFRTIRNPDTDIFETLSVQDYKTIRKRMIGNILATDMVNHGKIMTVIKSRISINLSENKKKFELLSGNEKTKFEEQQSLFDFLIHSADLAHNTKLFDISLKWVQLLSEEFWLQGDKEKSMNLPVSFLCDRDTYNVPKSQVGFIKAFIIPTYECLVNVFPTLQYSLDNAKINLKKWQKLVNKKRLKGWTPEKTKQVNYKEKMLLFNAINSFTENNNNNAPIKIFSRRKSGTLNSLSHELQFKGSHKDQKDDNNNDIPEQNEKIINETNKNKKKIFKPPIINKTKNHDKKVHVKHQNKK